MRILFSICLISSFFQPGFSQDSFTKINGVPGGTIYSIQVDPVNNKLYALSIDNYYMAYTSTDNGTNWQRFLTPTKIRSLLVDGSKLHYTDNSAFYTSTDGGANWIKKSLGNINTSWRTYLVKLPVAGEVFALYSCEGVFISTDAGTNWKQISSGSECGFGMYSMTYSGAGDIYFWTSVKGVFKHTVPLDGIWDASKVVKVSGNLVTTPDQSLSVGVSSTNKIYITYRNSANTANLIAYSNSGNDGTFTNVVTQPIGIDLNNYNFWSLSPAGKLNLFAGGKPYELTNEATNTWTVRSIPNAAYGSAMVNTVTWKSDTEVFAGTEGSGVFRSTNAGSSWTFLNGTPPNAIMTTYGSDIEVLGNNTIVVKEDFGSYGVWTSSDGGQSFTWRPQSFYIVGPGAGQKLTKLQDNSIVAQTSDGTRITSDGITWTKQNGAQYPFYIPVGANELYGLGPDGYALSTDAGITWTAKSVTGMPSQYQSIFAFYLNGNFFLSINNSSNNNTEYWKIDASVNPWVATKLVTPLITSSQSCRGFFTLNSKIYGSDGTKIAISADNGVTWSSSANNHNVLVPVRQGTGGIAVSTNQALMVTQDDGKNWRGYSITDGGEIRDFAFDNGNNIYTTSMAGTLQKFTGNLILPANEIPPTINTTWQPLKGPNSGYYKKLLKNNTGQFFALSNWSLYRYNTASLQWDRMVNTEVRYGLSDAYIDGAGKIYSISSNQIFSSSNGGTSWTKLQEGGQYTDMKKVIKATNGNIIVTKSSGVLLSTNDGSSFIQPATANTGAFDHINVSSTGTLLTSRVLNGVNSLMRSTDNGVTWTSVTGVDLSNNKEVFSITTLEAGTLAVVTTDNIYKTTNGGSSWISIKGTLSAIETGNNRFGRKVYLSPVNNQYYFSNYSGFHSSSDGGVTWTKLNTTDLPDEFFDFTWINSSIYKSTPAGVQVSTDNGISFTGFQGNKGLFSSSLYTMAATNGNLFAAAPGIGGQIFKSMDNGQTFTKQTTGIYADYLSKLPSGKLVAMGGGIALSDDGGTTWVNQNPGDGYYWQLTSPDGVNFFCIRDLNGVSKIVKSNGNLSAWTDVFDFSTLPGVSNNYPISKDNAVYFLGWSSSTNPNHNVYKIQFGNAERVDFPTEPESVHLYNNKLYVFSWSRVLYESEDGITWTSRATPSGGRMTVTNNGYFFVRDTNTSELWLSRDQGKNWQSIEFSGYETYKYDIDESTGYAYALVPDRPILRSSSIILPNDNTAPLVTTLNPANADVNIPLNLKIAISFNEAAKGVVGKKVRLYESSNVNNPIEVFDAPTGALSDNAKTITFTPTVSINYLKNYFITIDNGAFTDFYGNAYTGISNQTSWAFTTMDEPDVIKPVVTFTTTSPNLETGSPRVFEITVSDNKSISAGNTKIYYRGISTTGSTPFSSSQMIQSSGATNTTAKFTVTVDNTWYDDMGLEFYFETKDNTGNIAWSPSSTSIPTSFHYSYIKYVTTKPKITNLPFGETERSYRIISVPHTVVDNQVATLFDELGESNVANWRLLTYASDDQYNEYPGKISTISRGVGYWYITKTYQEIQIDNATTPENNRTRAFSMMLNKGWNMIGNPYPVPISWNEVRAANANIGPVKIYNNGNYTNGDELKAYEGGFVYLTSALTSPITVRFKGIISGGRVSSTGSDLNSANWELPIHIRQGEMGNEIGGIGMNERASDDADEFDDYNPPPVSNRLQLDFRVARMLFAKNIVPSQNSYVWKFETTSDGVGLIKLNWDNKNFGETLKGLYLVDEEEQFIVDMRGQNHYEFDSKGSRKFTIHFGENIKDQIKPSVTLLGNPSPNPASGKVNIPFTVSDHLVKSYVRIEVYNSIGKRVSELYDGIHEVGFHSLEWNVEDSGLANGIYFCRMLSHPEGATAISQTKKIIINR